jgi:hypothetical protein
MKIQPQVRNKYAKQIIRTVETSKSPLGIPQVLKKLHATHEDLNQDLAVALLWHLLATHELQFDSDRRLKSTRKSTKSVSRNERELVGV